jgi:hypothetical protein
MRTTKKFANRNKSYLITIIVFAFLLTSVQRCPTLVLSKPLTSSSAAMDDAAPDYNDNKKGGTLVEYAPVNEGRTLQKIVNWGLSKIENVVYGDVRISDLIDAFATRCDAVFAIMVRSVMEISHSYEELLTLENERLSKFDAEFVELVKLRNRIERKCARVTTVDDRSLCVDGGMDIRGKIDDLRGKRSRSIDAIARYEGMIEWCASYGNWFC